MTTKDGPPAEEDPVCAAIARVLRIPSAAVLDDLEYQSIPQWDSLRHVNLMLALENEFGVDIDDDALAELRSVRQIRHFIAGRPATGLPAVPPSYGNVRRGLDGVVFDFTAITRIDGRAGVLEHRGYNIGELLEHATFEEMAWLLLEGELPDEAELETFRRRLAAHRRLPLNIVDLLENMAAAHPLVALRSAISALGAAKVQIEPHEAELEIIAKIPSILAVHHALRRGCAIPQPLPGGKHAENLAHMLCGVANSDMAWFLERDLIVHADHGSNASAFAARVATSCQADVHSAIVAAIATFGGPLHGGAIEDVLKMLDQIGTPQNAEAFVRDRHLAGLPVPGFGHRVYRTTDPRAPYIRASTRRLAAQRGGCRELEIIDAVAEAMLPYAKYGVAPNVDLHAGVGYRLLDLPDDLATALFAAGRVVGWVAQIREQAASNILIRPLLEYTGPAARPFRREAATADEKRPAPGAARSGEPEHE